MGMNKADIVDKVDTMNMVDIVDKARPQVILIKPYQPFTQSLAKIILNGWTKIGHN
jgi:ABC-type dipeptide/oligopeptide/nickel transport system ATPase component